MGELSQVGWGHVMEGFVRHKKESEMDFLWEPTQNLLRIFDGEPQGTLLQ